MFQRSDISLYKYFISDLQIFRFIILICKDITISIYPYVQTFHYANFSIHYSNILICKDITISKYLLTVQIFLIHMFQCSDISLYKYFISDSQTFWFTILYSNLQYHNIQISLSIRSDISLYKYFISDSQTFWFTILYSNLQYHNIQISLSIHSDISLYKFFDALFYVLMQGYYNIQISICFVIQIFHIWFINFSILYSIFYSIF